jgi:hypothetical protein
MADTVPEIRYARSGDVHVAYQVVGDGPVDIVFVEGSFTNRHVQWEAPLYRRFLGADRNPADGKVVTYNKWPLYTYVADSAPGQATGEGVSLSGGKWYVISPSGQLIKHKT